MTPRTIIVPETQANQRVDHALATLMPEYSRTLIKEWIISGLVLINGNIIKAKTKVKNGDVISVEIKLKSYPQWEAQNIPISIVHEDEAVIVINKPVGMIVHPGAGNADHTLLNALLHHAPELQALPRAGLLHRLDKNTSGLLVIAKTASSLKHLSHQLKKRVLLREYQAVVNGTFISGGTIDAPIGRHPLQRKRMAVIETGKPAITHYRIAEKYRTHTRLTMRLDTGRTHQIRVHMAYIHHPIVGDETYGGRIQISKHMLPELIQYLREFKRQALHAFALGFTHPLTHVFIRFEVDLPHDMQKLIHLLKIDSSRT